MKPSSTHCRSLKNWQRGILDKKNRNKKHRQESVFLAVPAVYGNRWLLFIFKRLILVYDYLVDSDGHSAFPECGTFSLAGIKNPFSDPQAFRSDFQQFVPVDIFNALFQ